MERTVNVHYLFSKSLEIFSSLERINQHYNFSTILKINRKLYNTQHYTHSKQFVLHFHEEIRKNIEICDGDLGILRENMFSFSIFSVRFSREPEKNTCFLPQPNQLRWFFRLFPWFLRQRCLF